jgi:hypothetical protein
MGRSRLALIYCSVLTFAIALAACGDGDSEEDSQIRDAIETAATSGDPAACTQVETQRFVDQISFGSGQAALKACRKEASETPADSIEVSDIEVDGDIATAEGAATGQIFDGQTLVISLVKEGDQWKLDQITGFAAFDRDAFNAAFAAEINGGAEFPAKVDECLVGQVSGLSDEELQNKLLSSDEALDTVFTPCFER